ncbi:hypothetical protein PC9H_000023 [Pleurotus ostreatus]|uniref:Uncharacterized protein n=1 Tax=Pleurotus ostreatus TaxID=5322 RepID=A0A8H7DW87_PLEOS|nr:uncharacterized protein PC9H_000023 [Pleurotus ostreatus]KAF7439687.1 hypothetical protein PC9H_000023 [Pleurotus ostreatus]
MRPGKPERQRLFLIFTFVATRLAVSVSAAPANDWSKPCFNGECAYDLPEHSNSGLGALKISGSPKSITDITSAAGWVVLDCDPHMLEQEIRLVCQSDDDVDDSACNHVFEHWGPQDKIVRLPESCGSGPFARIAAASVATNQDLPAHAEGKVVRRSGTPPVIHSFKIDTNFDLVDVEKVGPINFAFVGLTSPSPSETFTNPDIDLNFEFVDSWFDNAFQSVGTWVSNAATTTAQAVTGAAKDVAKAAERVGTTVAKVAGSVFKKIEEVGGLLENATHFEFEPTVALVPVKYNGSASLIDYHPQGCPGGGGPATGGVVTGALKVDVTGVGNGNVKAGIIVDGAIVPPKIHNFAAFAGLSFDIDASVTIKAAVFGGYDSGKVSIIKPLSLPGFSIPGVLAVGPMIELQGQAKAFLDMKIDSVVHLAYQVDDCRCLLPCFCHDADDWNWHTVELWYPKSKKKSTEKGINTKPSPLKLKAKAKANAKGYIEGHLIPTLRLGVSALGGKAGADVYLEADAFARVSVKAEAHGSATGKVAASPAASPAKGSSPAKAAAPAKGKKGKRDGYVPPYLPHARRNVDVHAAAKGGFSGCLWLEAGMELRYGARANAGDLWSVNESGPLWTSPIWPVWSVRELFPCLLNSSILLLDGCFAGGKKAAGKVTEKSTWDATTLEAKFKEKKLTCDTTDEGELEAIQDESIPKQTLLK